MTELEKLKAVREIYNKFSPIIVDIAFDDWLRDEIARLEDSHAEARKALENFKGSYFAHQRAIHDLFQHLESELAKAKAAAEPLDPKRVLATAATLTDMLDVSGERKKSIRDALIWSVDDLKTRPYEVQE
jgi:hypothetical protein